MVRKTKTTTCTQVVAIDFSKNILKRLKIVKAIADFLAISRAMIPKYIEYFGCVDIESL
jgi:hypothetical protein